MRRSSAASRTFLLAVALLAGCSIYEPSLLVDAPPDYDNGGSDGDGGTEGDAGTGGTEGEAGSDGEAGEGGTEGEAGEGGSDGEAGEGGSDGEAGEGGESGEGGSSAGTGGASGKGGAAGKAGASGAPTGGAGGAGGASGKGGAGGSAGKSGSGGAAGSTTGGNGGTTGGAAGATGGKGGSAGGGTCDGRLVINEVSIGKGSSDGDEMVELYNPTGCEVVLTDWALKYASQNVEAWPTGTIWTGGATAKIAPNGYFVIGNTAYISGGGTPDETGKLGMAVSAGIGLFPTVTSPTPVDSVAWGSVSAMSPATETTPAKTPGTTKTIARSATSADTDNNLADFSDQPRSPGVANP